MKTPAPGPEAIQFMRLLSGLILYPSNHPSNTLRMISTDDDQDDQDEQDTDLVSVDHVLPLVYHRKLTVAPVIHACVQLPVKRLEILQSSPDQPSSEDKNKVRDKS